VCVGLVAGSRNPQEYCKGRGKVHTRTGHEDPEGEQRYRSTLSLTSALYEGDQRHASVALPPGKTLYPLYRRLGGPQGRCGRLRKILSPPGFDPRTVQPVASRYTDCVVPTLQECCIFMFTPTTTSCSEANVVILIHGYNGCARDPAP
jgi:hypothetical protein